MASAPAPTPLQSARYLPDEREGHSQGGNEETMVEQIAGAPLTLPPRTEPTGQLIREAIDETRHLVQLEVALARAEMRAEIAQAKAGAITLAVAAVAGIAAFTMFMVTIALAFVPSSLAASVVAAVLLLVGGTAGIVGWKALPKQLLGTTRARLQSDYKQLKERIA
jgi:hypothetical protein